MKAKSIFILLFVFIIFSLLLLYFPKQKSSILASTHNISSGWNMISWPMVDSLSISEIENYCGSVTIYRWSSSNNEYQKVNSIAPGEGYWLRATNPCRIPLKIGKNWSGDVYLAGPGWHMVGSPKGGIDTDSISGNCQISAIWGWDTFAKKYVRLNRLEEGQGYWFRVNGPCRLDLSASSTGRLFDTDNPLVKHKVSTTLGADSSLLQLTNRPIYSLSISGSASINDIGGFARVILTDSSGKQHLVYGAFGPYDQGYISFNYACHETCNLNGIIPRSVEVEIEGATINIEEVYTLNNTAGFQVMAEGQRALTYEQSIVKQKPEEIINKINEYNRSNNLRWTAGQTSVSHYSYQEKKNLLGFSSSDRIPNLYGVEYYTGGVFEVAPPERVYYIRQLPNSFSWKNNQGVNWMTPVKDQGDCGSCWAFAATGAIEAQLNIHFRQLMDINLSEQDLVSCYHGKGCWGLNPITQTNTFPSYLKNNGVIPSECFEYGASHDLSCSLKCRDYQNLSIKLNDIGSFLSYDSSKVKEVLINKGPLFMAGTWPILSHAMVLVGYEFDTARSTNVWTFKNSWGVSWGEEGYIRATRPASLKALIPPLYYYYEPSTNQPNYPQMKINSSEDYTRPQVERWWQLVDLGIPLDSARGKIFSAWANVSDNAAVHKCYLCIDGDCSLEMSLDREPCSSCRAKIENFYITPGNRKAKIKCYDVNGNVGWSEYDRWVYIQK